MLSGQAWCAWAGAAAAFALVAVNGAIIRRQSASFTWLMLLAAAVLAFGDLRWALGLPVAQVVPTWIAFFVLTIVAERLEMSRLAPTPSWAKHALAVVGVALAAVSCAATGNGDVAGRAVGVATALLALWQLRFDLARRTLRQPGLPRYAAVGVLAGAVWLLVGGTLMAVQRVPPAGPLYDAVLHAVFLGYVLSMVFAHAPITLPSVARVSLPYHPVLAVVLAALHASVAARLAGDLLPSAWLREAGAIGNALVLVAFVVAVLYARARRATP